LNPVAQSVVAAGMAQYTKKHALAPQALLMLGDSWYGDLTGGIHSPRWQTQFEEMYRQHAFARPAFSIAATTITDFGPTVKSARNWNMRAWGALPGRQD